MPEGQVSHRNAIRFTRALGGRDLVRVLAPEPRLGPQRIPERLAGDRVDRVDAAGKHHLFRFGSGRVLHSHLVMHGVWRLVPADRPLPRGSLWLALCTEEWVAAQYRGPVLRLLEPGERPAGVPLLGPDLLDAAVDPGAAAVSRLARVDPGREVGEALMDQRVVAGIGNVPWPAPPGSGRARSRACSASTWGRRPSGSSAASACRRRRSGWSAVPA